MPSPSSSHSKIIQSKPPYADLRPLQIIASDSEWRLNGAERYHISPKPADSDHIIACLNNGFKDTLVDCGSMGRFHGTQMKMKEARERYASGEFIKLTWFASTSELKAG